MDETADRQAPVIIALVYEGQVYQMRAELIPDFVDGFTDAPLRWQARFAPIEVGSMVGTVATGFHNGPAAALAEAFADLLSRFQIEPQFAIETLRIGIDGPPKTGDLLEFPYWFMRRGGHGSWHRVPAGQTVSHCGIARAVGDHIDSDAEANAMKRLCAVCLNASNR